VIEQETARRTCSALTDDCVARGRHLKEAARCKTSSAICRWASPTGGLGWPRKKSACDEEKRSRGEALWNALLSTFDGEEGERIRQALLRRAK
jgi:formate C-acetyltransferase